MEPNRCFRGWAFAALFSLPFWITLAIAAWWVNQWLG